MTTPAMVGLVIVTHGRLADELRSAMEHVVGQQAYLETVCVGPEDDLEARRIDILSSIARVEQGRGVLLLTDMFGGTPSNLAISTMNPGVVEVLSGVNLPMLVKLGKIRNLHDLPDCISCAQAAGRKYIASASDILPNCRLRDCST